jgi:F-type H+-transporting ATPase subunit a
MLAGHILLITFAVLTAALFTASWTAIILPFPFVMLVGLTGFEILVSFLQAYIFTILTAVYIGGALHPEH